MVKRFLTHPGVIVAVLFLGQFAFWFFFMPEQPTIKSASPRYDSSSALLQWAVFFIIFEASIILGTLIPVSQKYRVALQEGHIRFWWRWALIIMSFALLGELVYIRTFLQNPELFSELLTRGNLAALGELARSERRVGISSLNNLFLLSTAILAVLSFHPHVPKPWVSRARWWLAGLGLVVVFHAFFLAARMFFVYYLLVVLAAYFTLKKVSARLFFYILIALAALIWIGELFRSGAAFAKSNQLSLIAPEVQVYTWERLAQGYFAADFNNALIIMSCNPSMQLWSTTMLAGPLGIQAYYDECPGWQGVDGTVNVLALWWYDWGWTSIVVAIVTGFVLGALYKLRLAVYHLRPEGFYFLLAFPGLFSILRINFFFLTIWVLPFLFLALIHLTYLIRISLKGTKQ